MKKTQKAFITIIIFLFTSVPVYSQKFSALKHKWKTPTPRVEIPDSLKNEDVVIIDKVVQIYNNKDVKSSPPLFAHSSLYLRCRIQTKAGLDNFTNFSIPKSRTGTPNTIDARTIKKDGTVILLDRNSIKSVRSYNKFTESYYSEYKISISGVEIGDDVEIMYTVSYNSIITTHDFYLHDEYSIMSSKLVLSTDRGIITNTYSNNDLPDPIRVETDKSTIQTWKLSSLRALGEQYGMIKDLDLPFVRIIVSDIQHDGFKYDVGLKDWGEVFDNLAAGSLEQKLKPKGLETYFASKKSILDTLSTVGKINYFVQFINDEIEIKSYLNDDDDKLSYVQLFQKKIIDERNLINFYKHLFFNLKIPYSVILAKNRYDGEFLVHDISSDQITDIFFEFKDESDNKHYLFPSTGTKLLNTNEIPYPFEGTKAVVLKKQDPSSKEKPSIDYMSIGAIKADNNSRKVNSKISLSDDGKCISKTQISYSGHYSTTYRFGLENLCEEYSKDEIIDWLEISDEDKPNFIFDTLLKVSTLQFHPFTTKFEFQSKSLNTISNGGGDLKNLNIKFLLPHIKFNQTDGDRYYTCYLPFGGQDAIVTVIDFPYPVEVINFEDIKVNALNSIGSYELRLEKISDTSYKLSSVFSLKKHVVSPAKYSEFKELNELIKKNTELSIVYKKI